FSSSFSVATSKGSMLIFAGPLFSKSSDNKPSLPQAQLDRKRAETAGLRQCQAGRQTGPEARATARQLEYTFRDWNTARPTGRRTAASRRGIATWPGRARNLLSSRQSLCQAMFAE